MKVKSESEVTQSCPTLSGPVDCSPPGSSVHGFSRQEYWSGVPSPSVTHVPAIVNSAAVNSVERVSFSVTLSSRVNVQYWDLLDPMVVLVLVFFFFFF